MTIRGESVQTGITALPTLAGNYAATTLACAGYDIYDHSLVGGSHSWCGVHNVQEPPIIILLILFVYL